MIFRILFLFNFFIVLSLCATERKIVFKDISFVIIEETENFPGSVNINLEIFDPQDTVLWPEHLPFMELCFSSDHTGELSTLAKTDSLSGVESIALAKMLAVEYGINRLELKDIATTLQCPYDGIFCKDESLHSLRNLCIFKYGKAFYEKEGASPLEDNGYRQTANFLFARLRACDLLVDLKPLENQFSSIKKFTDFLKDVLLQTSSPEDILLSDLFLKITALSRVDETSHLMWHQFMDQVISHKDSFFIDVVGWILDHVNEYDPKLVRAAALYLCEYHAICTNFAGNNKDLILEFLSNPLSSKNRLPIKQLGNNIDGLFKHTMLSQIYNRRATKLSQTKNVLNYLIPFRSYNFQKVLLEARKYISPNGSLTGMEPIFDCREAEFSELLEEFSKSDHIFPPGHLYILFEISKVFIEGSSEFVFEFM